MTTEELARRLIAASGRNRHDIAHFLKVWAYTRLIGTAEGLDAQTQRTLETAALLHDIACPLCREKYGNTNGKYQEREGMPLAEAFVRDAGLPEACRERVVFLVGHHHTLTGIDGPDWQILLEADYLVNADESGYTPGQIRAARQTLFRTAAGRALLDDIYGCGAREDP